jgi:hypothetical protein
MMFSFAITDWHRNGRTPEPTSGAERTRGQWLRGDNQKGLFKQLTEQRPSVPVKAL